MTYCRNKLKFALRERAAPRRVRHSALLLTFATIVLSISPTARARDGGWDFETYRIQIAVAIDTPGGLADYLADELPRYLQQRIDAALIPAWTCDVRVANGIERTKVLANVAATSDPPPPDFPADKDKLLLASVRWTPDAIVLTAREFDRHIQRWSVPIRRESQQEAALPEQLFAVIWQSFSPLVQIELDDKDPLRAVLTPRGALLPRASGTPPLAKPGDVFLPVLRRTTRGGQLEKKDGAPIVPWTYVEVTEVKGNTIAGRIQSASRRPFPARKQGRTEQVAIAMRSDPETSALRLRSRTAADKPLIGYEVFSQKPGDEALTRIGISDTAGQIAVPPGKTPIQFLLVKNGGQLLARIPFVAGAFRRVEVPLADDDTRLAAEAHLAAVREDLIDVVARRNILISRARQKIQKKDYKAAEELLRALNDLPARPQFKQTLDVAQRTLKSDDPQMQRRIQQLFDATQTLLTQFLDLRPINQLNQELREAQRSGGTKTPEPASASKG